MLPSDHLYLRRRRETESHSVTDMVYVILSQRRKRREAVCEGRRIGDTEYE
jgi:hypothetical protein